MVEVKGKVGIVARVLQHSITTEGIEFLTFEAEKPRIVLAEENTHKMISKSSASSRAIPFAKMQDQLTGRPVRFGQANVGMQDKGEDYTEPVISPFTGHAYHPAEAWDLAKGSAQAWSRAFFEAGYHKQVYNRLTESAQMMKTIFSATEWENFFWLRNHCDADPTLEELARCMYEAKQLSAPLVIYPGEWHLPYVDRYRDNDGVLRYGDWVQGEGFIEFSVEDAKKVSAARCAAVSFRNVDYTLEKSLQVYERLLGSDRKHASAFEHQATPIAPESESGEMFSEEYKIVNVPYCVWSWEEGITHMDRDEQLWSGNLRGYIQHRKLIPGENYTGNNSKY